MIKARYWILGARILNPVCYYCFPNVAKRIISWAKCSAIQYNNNHEKKKWISPLERYTERKCNSSSSAHIVEVRGLDPETREEDVLSFFRSLNITPVSIKLRWDNAGRVSGACEVQFSTYAEAVAAMRKKNTFIGDHFIRLKLKSPDAEGTTNNSNRDGVSPPRVCHLVRMRGLPIRITEKAIFDFFCPLNVRPISIRPVYDDDGQAIGEYDVEFLTHEDAVKAMTKNNTCLGKRFVQLTLNSESDITDDKAILNEFRSLNQNF